MKNYLPIVKVAIGLLAAGLVAGLHALGITLGDADADYYATAFIGLVVAYIVPDPRVQKLSHKLGLREKLRLLNVVIQRQAYQDTMKVGSIGVKPVVTSVSGPQQAGGGAAPITPITTPGVDGQAPRTVA